MNNSERYSWLKLSKLASKIAKSSTIMESKQNQKMKVAKKTGTKLKTSQPQPIKLSPEEIQGITGGQPCHGVH